MTTPVSTAPGTATDLLAAAGGAVALGSQPSAGATSDSAAGFFALVLQALQTGTPTAGTADGTPGATPGSAATGDVPVAGTGEEKAEPTPEQQPATIDPSALLGLGLALPLTPAVPVATAAATPATTTANPADATVAAPGGSTGAPVAAAAAAVEGGEQQDAAAGDSPDGQQAAPAPTSQAPSAPAAVPSAAVPIDPATSALPTPAAQPAAPITAAPATATAPAPAPVSVPDQVFGEVTSLVSRGNGTHRITMTLNPEQLGEVRVVMTVRDGAVHVRLAAGSEARASLLEGSPELSRLLTQAGATDTRVVVRDLPVAAAASTSSSSNDPNSNAGTSSQTGASANHQQDQHARTRAEHPATDGNDTPSRRLPAAGPAALRPIDNVTSNRPAGLDVTM